MITLFVTPKIDKFFKDRGLHSKAKQLLISSVNDDGSCWFGVKDAIKNYCAEYGVSIENIKWRIMVRPGDYNYATIQAKNLTDWEKQFNALNVIFNEE